MPSQVGGYNGNEAIANCQTDPPEIREDFALDEALMEAAGMNDPKYKFRGKPKRLTPDDRARIRGDIK